MQPDEKTKLIDEARLARERAHAPYSKFLVGAALMTSSGRIYRGCNVENSTFGLTVCAERVALLAAIADGERSFRSIAVMTQSEHPSTPCGACRQFIWEFCGDIEVVVANLKGESAEYKMSEIFPLPFLFVPES